MIKKIFSFLFIRLQKSEDSIKRSNSSDSLFTRFYKILKLSTELVFSKAMLLLSSSNMVERAADLLISFIKFVEKAILDFKSTDFLKNRSINIHGTFLTPKKSYSLKAQFRVLLFILFAAFAMVGSPALANKSCKQILIADSHLAFEFLLKFRKDYLPFSAKRLKRDIDRTDLYLLEESYRRGGLHEPIEMGIVELLDHSGKVLDSAVQVGVHKSVYGQNQASINLLERNSHRLQEIATVRRRHTHPEELNPEIIANAFSDGDMVNDQRFRLQMNQSSAYKHIRAESWIVFINFDLQSHDPVDLVPRDAKTRGYLIE